PADGLAEVGTASVRRGRWRAVQLDVLLKGPEAERNVGQVAVAVGHGDRLHRGAVGDDPDLHAVGVGQGVAPDRLVAAIRPGVRRAEVLFRDGRAAGAAAARLHRRGGAHGAKRAYSG